MAVTQCMPTAAKLGFLQGLYQPTDTYNIALYTQAAATWGPTSTVYSNVGELPTGGGYTQGGIPMVGFSTSSGNGEAWIYWTDNPSWPSSTFTADSAVIYNTTRSNAIIAVLAFGSAIAKSNTFTVVLPAPVAGAALIRIA